MDRVENGVSNSDPSLRPSDEALGALLRLLSDGQRRSTKSMSQILDQSEQEIEAALDVLTGAGMRVDKNAQGMSCDAFIPLDPTTIEAALMGHQLDAEPLVRTVIDSTNTQLLADSRAELLHANLTVLAAELQEAGRGRLGRRWHAAPGSSLTVSFAQALPLSFSALSGFSLMCGLAVHDALLMHGVDAQLKWPNDVLSEGRKLGGILIETQARADGTPWMVIGIGLNIAADEGRAHALAQREQALPATDLCASGARHPVDRNQLVADLALCLSRRIEGFVANGFKNYVEEWNNLHAFKDEYIALVEDGVSLVSGIVQGVDALGRLVVQTSQGLRTVVAGDVSVRPAA